MNKNLVLSLLLLAPDLCYAQLDLQALKMQKTMEAADRKASSNSFMSGREYRWGDFLDTRAEEWKKTVENKDLEWSDMLGGSAWTLFEDFLVKDRPEMPKPDVPPSASPDDTPENATIPVVVPSIVSAPQPEADKPVPVCKPAEPVMNSESVSWSFFGKKLTVGFDRSMLAIEYPNNGQKQIANFWKSLSETNYTPMIESLTGESQEMNLNDYGYYLLCGSFANQIYRSDANQATLLTWFILVRSGYNAKVGFSDSEVVLMIPSEKDIYGMSYLTFGDVNYYLMTNTSDPKLYTYEGDYADGCNFTFDMKTPVLLGEDIVSRTVSFEFEGERYEFDFKFNRQLTSFYKTCPALPFEVYFEAAPSIQLAASIKENLKPVVDGMDRIRALNFLLRFVQLSFDYKTDADQFGKEKYFYVEEVLGYPFCDCEDRAAFFAYLVHTLMGNDVVGVQFPGHMASAVEIDNEYAGTCYEYMGRHYTIADPTYIHSVIGQCMPQYRTTKPTIINLHYE